MEILAPVSLGELIDKISILHIKSDRIGDGAKLRNISRELTRLQTVLADLGIKDGAVDRCAAELRRTNALLWEAEDKIRELESRGDFGQEFVQTARLIHRENDKRFHLKREINVLMKSDILEEKAYATIVSPDAQLSL